MLWIALTLPELPLQVFTRGVDDPGALAVVEHRPRQRLVAATAAAQARGVAPGTSVAGALAVAPDLELRERNETLEHGTLEAFATWAGSFTPCVSIDAPAAIVLEVTGSLRLFGGLTPLVARLQQETAGLGLRTRLAAAPTPLAARWLAEEMPGTLINASSGWSRCLDALPLRALVWGSDVSQSTLELLHGIGARSIGEVARLPRDGLARRQAAGVMQALARARGDAPDPRLWHTPPESFESRLVLPAPVATNEPLLFAARRLIAELAGWLAGLHAAIDRCCLRLAHDGQPDTVLTVITGQPTRDEERLVMLVREHLAALTLHAPVEALQLNADKPVLRPACSADLFGDPARATDDASLLLDRLRARLGREAVRSVRPWPDHRPERAWREAEPGCADRQRHARGQADSVTDNTGWERLRRPSWLLPAPRALTSIRSLTFVSGPERLESGWWDGEDIRRDYYVARAPGAGLWWIFRRLDPPGGWYVHGYFG